MYSSLDNPTFEEWIEETERLINLLAQNTKILHRKLEDCLNKRDTFMIRHYCLKLLDVNKKLEFEKIVPSKEVD